MSNRNIIIANLRKMQARADERVKSSKNRESGMDFLATLQMDVEHAEAVLEAQALNEAIEFISSVPQARASLT